MRKLMKISQTKPTQGTLVRQPMREVVKHKSSRNSGLRTPLRYNHGQYIGGLLLPTDPEKSCPIP
jgi:hypothetical protein